MVKKGRIYIIAVGKLRHPYKVLENEFLKRMENVEIIEIREKGRLYETRCVVDKLKEKDWFIILCDVEGKLLTTDEFSILLKEKLNWRNVCFLIGGSNGFEKELLKSYIHMELSLSPMTFNHQLCRIVLLEQIYRVVMRWKGHPYSTQH